MRRKRASSDEPVAVDALAQRVSAQLSGSSPDVMAALLADLGSVIGDQRARGLRAISLVGGVLTVAVDDPARAVQLRYEFDAITRAVNKRFGVGTVIRVRAVRPRKP